MRFVLTALMVAMAGGPYAAIQPQALAQQAPAPIERQLPQMPGLRVESRLVPVAVNVVDEHGSPVAGLTQEDFEVFEDNKAQKIAVFDKEATTPLQIVLALDSSESVAIDDHLEHEAAKTFVKTLLRAQDRLDLMYFSDNVDEVVGFTNDVKRIESGLGNVPHGDATALYDAIYLASQRMVAVPLAGARRVVVVITDGENTTHHGSYDAALEQAERAGAMIYSLIIVPVEADAGRNTGGEHALIQMANDTGGKYYYVSKKQDLAPAFAHVSDDLRTQYTVGYYAPQRGVDPSGLRHIRLQLKDPEKRSKYDLRYRTAYYGNNVPRP
ncbi:VWA domain-containing protein [Granulicella paludicola]|uniref:VWA domain-containing protein n=1 Tax=Granulicella paludicola TaxID=474951 RepID=UPI0021E0BEFE|nr:VWA domain-containing protein [Granulicella paludicola]